MTDDTGTRPLRRRDFLGLAVTAAALAGATSAIAEVCDADDIEPGQASMRLALEYVAPSKTPGKVCAGCAFFTKSSATCGNCQLLHGPVSPGAVCGSWAPRK